MDLFVDVRYRVKGNPLTGEIMVGDDSSTF